MPLLQTKPLARIALSGRARLFICCLFLLSAITAALPARGQTGQEVSPSKRQTPPDETLEGDEVLRIDTDLVLVDVLVTDAQGRPVRNLRPEDFKVYEDGEARDVAFFNIERRGGAQRPVAVVFAVDVSGSMTLEEMLRLQSAMREFSKGMSERPASFALMSFGMSAKVYQSFTNDPQKLNRAFERLAREINGLSTHTYDAVDDAIRLLVRDAPRTRERRLMKRAVVVVTDGFPVGDTVSPKTVIERANAAEVSIYTVTLPSYSRLLAPTEGTRSPLPTPLDVSGVAEKTGGTSIYATDKDYTPLFKALAEEVTSTYVLAFYPPEEKRHDGRYHSLRIEAPPGYTIRQSRTGYQAATSRQKAESSR